MDEHNAHTQKTSLAKRTLLIIAAALGLGIVFDFLFFDKAPGISFIIYVLLVLGVLAGTARWFRVGIPRAVILLVPPLLFFAGMVFVWADGLLTFLNIVASLYIVGLMLYLLYKPRIETYTLSDYVRPVLQLPLRLAVHLRQTLGELSGVRYLAGKHEAAPQIIVGVLIALPVLLVFVLLFASADLVFRKYITDIVSLNVSEELYARAFLVTIVTALFAAVLGYIAHRPATLPDMPANPDVPVPKTRGQIEATILFGSLNVLFLSFIAVQLTYLFGGQQNITDQGFTYAEYARKGYFELIAVAAMALALILATDKILLRKGTAHTTRFKVLAGALIVQVLIVMVSAFNRLSLYEGAYGFTSLRLYSHIGLVWLAVVFALLLYKIFASQRESAFAFLTFVSVLVLLAGVNIVNVDKYVANRNIARYHATGKLDAYYLHELSDDAIPEVVTLLDAANTTSSGVASALYQKRQDMLHAKQPWQSANLSRQAALRALDARAEYIEQHKYDPMLFQVRP